MWHCSANLKYQSVALLSQAKISECGTVQPSYKIRVWHCSAKLKILSVALLNQAKKSECHTSQPS